LPLLKFQPSYLRQSILLAGISTAEWVPSSVSIQRRYPLCGL